MRIKRLRAVLIFFLSLLLLTNETAWAVDREEQIDIDHLVVRAERSDYESDEAFANFRPVCMGNISEGVLYRSSSPIGGMGEERARTASILMEKAKICTVVNLAYSEEELQAVMSPGVCISPYYKTLYEQGNIYTEILPYSYTSEEFAQGISRAVTFLAEHEPPYLVHCVGGKDRTGFTVMILGMLMGATDEEIISDYMKTNEYFYGILPGTEAYEILANRSIRSLMAQIIQADESEPITEKTLRHAAKLYLHKIGIPEEKIKILEIKLGTGN